MRQPDDAHLTKAYRSHKEACGHYFRVEEPSRDWAWYLGIFCVGLLALAVYVFL